MVIIPPLTYESVRITCVEKWGLERCPDKIRPYQHIQHFPPSDAEKNENAPFWWSGFFFYYLVHATNPFMFFGISTCCPPWSLHNLVLKGNWPLNPTLVLFYRIPIDSLNPTISYSRQDPVDGLLPLVLLPKILVSWPATVQIGFSPPTAVLYLWLPRPCCILLYMQFCWFPALKFCLCELSTHDSHS